MKNMSAADVAAKWSQNAGAATQYWVNGINATTTAPGPAAAAAADTWATNTVAAKAKFVAKLGTQTLSQWQQAAVAKGQTRYSQGITAGATKYTNAITKVLAAEKTIVAGLPARGGLEANIARSAAFARAMNQAAESGQFS